MASSSRGAGAVSPSAQARAEAAASAALLRDSDDEDAPALHGTVHEQPFGVEQLPFRYGRTFGLDEDGSNSFAARQAEARARQQAADEERAAAAQADAEMDMEARERELDKERDRSLRLTAQRVLAMVTQTFYEPREALVAHHLLSFPERFPVRDTRLAEEICLSARDTRAALNKLYLAGLVDKTRQRETFQTRQRATGAYLFDYMSIVLFVRHAIARVEDSFDVHEDASGTWICINAECSNVRQPVTTLEVIRRHAGTSAFLCEDCGDRLVTPMEDPESTHGTDIERKRRFLELIQPLRQQVKRLDDLLKLERQVKLQKEKEIQQRLAAEKRGFTSLYRPSDRTKEVMSGARNRRGAAAAGAAASAAPGASDAVDGGVSAALTARRLEDLVFEVDEAKVLKPTLGLAFAQHKPAIPLPPLPSDLSVDDQAVFKDVFRSQFRELTAGADSTPAASAAAGLRAPLRALAPHEAASRVRVRGQDFDLSALTPEFVDRMTPEELALAGASLPAGQSAQAALLI